MSTTYDDSSPQTERLLYSPHKALDAVLALGAIPKRLFRIFYPLWRVRVEGRQRLATDFEELEWYMERGIHEGGLTSVATLAHFFGLEARFVERLVNFLRAIGHIVEGTGPLALTPLGRESLQARVRYQEQRTSAWLYFDGLDSRPLTLEHYAIPVYDDLSANSSFFALYQFDREWDPISLRRLMETPSDRHNFNLPDELTHIDRPLAQEPTYMPIYVVERLGRATTDLPLFLVFSRVRSLRDTVLEPVVNQDILTQEAFRQLRAGDLEHAAQGHLARCGLREDEWYLQANGPWGAQVMVDAGALRRLTQQATADSEARSLTIRDVGKYLLAYDWCLWLTCDDVAVRQEAAIAQLLEWLQFTTANPTSADLARRIRQMAERLRIDPITPDVLLEAAAQQGQARAVERLDGMEAGVDSL